VVRVFRLFDARAAWGCEGEKQDKPLAWHHDQPGLDASFIYESSAFSWELPAGKVRKTCRIKHDLKATSQETCHFRAA
jgi:hypothetical protein